MSICLIRELLKKFPLNPQKFYSLCNTVAQLIKVLREFEGFFTKNLSIQTCPDLSSRAEFGHWEGDTVELIRGQSYFVTLVERKTRFLLTKLMPNKKSETVRNAILSVFVSFSQAVKSITLNNGTEFADHKTIANRLNVTVYFAHPH